MMSEPKTPVSVASTTFELEKLWILSGPGVEGEVSCLEDKLPTQLANMGFSHLRLPQTDCTGQFPPDGHVRIVAVFGSAYC